MIHYFCPDQQIKSGGIRQIYRHVEMLVKHGLPAFVLHTESGYRVPDLPEVPIKYLQESNCLASGNIMVIPEGFPGVMMKTRNMPLRRFAFALNWSYIFKGLETENWRDFGIERVITVLPFIADLIEWSMGLPVDVLDFTIEPSLYYPDQAAKRKKIVYFARKAECVIELTHMLRSRRPMWLNEIEWVKMENLAEPDYAREMREAMIYLALGTAEGLNQTVYEAMRCRTLVAGFNGIGLQGVMIGDGKEQNCILAENGDYITLGMRLEPALNDLVAGNFNNWQTVIERGEVLAAPHTYEAEELSLLKFWQDVLATGR